MEFRFRTLRVTKLFPLAISRGSSSGSVNIYVIARDGEHEGIGEAAPKTEDAESLAQNAASLIQEIIKTGICEAGPHMTWQRGHEMGTPKAALAALDIALWDLLAHRAGLPLFQMLGLPKPTAATSVTLGISPVEIIPDRVPEMLKLWKARALKIKLGSRDGIEHDQASYLAAHKAAAPLGVKIRVDANGGWSPEEAATMIDWLAERDCEYVEQPLAADQDDAMPYVFANRKLPIFLDESVQLARDVPRVAGFCDGVNVKLMKTGGITEALRCVGAAGASGLKTMIGCMSDSSIGIAAGAAISGLFDYIDLDSHLNQNPDPGEGLKMIGGVVLPSDRPGHGAALVE